MKNKAVKIFAFFMVFVSVFSCFEFSAKASSFSPPALSGTTYTVSTAAHLRWISGVCNGEIKKGSEKYPSNANFSGYTIVMKNNVSLGNITVREDEYLLTSGDVWTPIGTESTPFSGTFDGKEYCIDGVFVNGGTDCSGFFGVIENAIISDLTVKGYISGKNSVGGIVAKGSGEINGCVFSGKIDGYNEVGGIVGKIQGTEETPSKVYLNVAACEINAFGGDCAGGIAGHATYTEITSCSSGANLYSEAIYNGGILGIATTGVKISCCSCNGRITADGEITTSGGILGMSTEYTELINNSFSGDVYSAAVNNALCGGIAGSFVGKIENSFVNGGVHAALYYSEEEINGVSVSAGIVADTTSAEINNCYFSGISECDGLEGDNICPSENITVDNVFYSVGTAYILYGTDKIYHVMALLDELTSWRSSKTGYSSWQSVSGVNEFKPLLKHTNAAGSDGKSAWKVEGTTFTFYTDGAMDDFEINQYGTIDTPWAVYRAGIRTVNIKKGVTRIGNNAFGSFDNLRTLTLPSTLKEIGDYAFEQCVYLKNFTFPSSLEDIGVAAFRRCKALTKVTLPKNIRSIRKNTFAYCDKLATVSIPDSVSLVGYMAFTMCPALTSVTFPESVKEIDDWAFYGCENLTTVSFPSGLNRIGSYAFGACELLVNYNIPSDATIEENAFWSEGIKGDIDGDGKLSVYDYLNIKAHLTGGVSLTKEQIKAADSDGNGKITVADYLSVKNILLGI